MPFSVTQVGPNAPRYFMDESTTMFVPEVLRLAFVRCATTLLA